MFYLYFMCFLVHIQSCDMHWRTTKNSNGRKDDDCQLLWSCSRRHHIISWRGWTGIFKFLLQFCSISDVMIQIWPYLINLNICMLSTSEQFYSLVITCIVLNQVLFSCRTKPFWSWWWRVFYRYSQIITVVCGLHSGYEETCFLQMQMLKIFILSQFVSYLHSQAAKKYHADYGVQVLYGLLSWVEKLLISLFWEQSQVMMWTFLHIIDRLINTSSDMECSKKAITWMFSLH